MKQNHPLYSVFRHGSRGQIGIKIYNQMIAGYILNVILRWQVPTIGIVFTLSTLTYEPNYCITVSNEKESKGGLGFLKE